MALRKVSAKAKKSPKATPKVVPRAKARAAPGARGRAGTSAYRRWVCRQCNYIYSEQIGEPHNGIKPGTRFEELPDSYVCPVCGYTAKGKVGKWGFEPWVPTKYVCRVCGYIYDKARGEPQHGIKPGTAFEDLPADYACPVCAVDTKINREQGRVGKISFDPLLE